MKKLSVVIPVYNAEKWLSETLNSLVNQTYENIEILCVDDGSSDGSCCLVEKYQENYPQIKLIHQKNSGVCAARNNGMDNATGDYIAFVDSDDYVKLDMYAELISLLESENSDIVFCEFTRFWSDGHAQTTIEHSLDKLKKNPQDIKYFIYSTPSYTEGDILHTDDIHGSACRSIFKITLLQQNKIRFHTDLKFAEDQIFVLEYLSCCKKVSYIPKSYVWYRGWTKKRHYGKIYTNQVALARYQENVVNRNTYYSVAEKKKLTGYLKCSAYFAILNDELSLNPDCVAKLKEYSENSEFNKLLTLYNFIQKYKVKADAKRILLFVLAKLKLWNVIKKVYPGKRY